MLGRAARGRGRRSRRLSGLDAVLVQFLAGVGRAERRPEVTQAFTQRSPYLWKSLWTQHEQRDHQHEDEVRGLKDVADHEIKLTGRNRTLGDFQPPTTTPARWLSAGAYG